MIAPSCGQSRDRSGSRTYLADGGNDIGVSAAAADVSGHGVLDVFVCRADGLFEQRHGAHDLAACAVAALVAVVLDEGGLHGVEIVGLADALDCCDLIALVHDREREAAVHAAAIDVDSAGTALAVIATLLGAGEVDAFPQRVEKRG